MNQAIKLYMERPVAPFTEEDIRNKTTTIVPVLASFDTAGNIEPKYIQIKDTSYKIAVVSTRRYGNLHLFHCEVDNCGNWQKLSLAYNPRDCIWYF